MIVIDFMLDDGRWTFWTDKTAKKVVIMTLPGGRSKIEFTPYGTKELKPTRYYSSR